MCNTEVACDCLTLWTRKITAVRDLIPFNFTGGADKSLARPGRKQATATEDFEFHISCL